MLMFQQKLSKKKFDKNLKKQFFNTCKFSNYDINKFILLLRKGVCSYEHMDDSKKFNKISLPEKEDFYSHLNMEDITDANYTHAKRVCKDLNNLGEYRDSYIQSHSCDVFKNFQNMCLEMYELDLD